MNKKGFTLIELMLAVAISGIILAGMWRMTKGGTLAFLRAQSQAEVISSGERALRGFAPDRGILEDIRRCSAVTSILPGQLNLMCPDGSLKYYLQGTNLSQVVAGSTSTVAKNIASVNFRYFKIQNGLLSLTTDPALVASVEISSIQVVNKSTVYILGSSARLRNK